jgi:hypothetical protein
MTHSQTVQPEGRLMGSYALLSSGTLTLAVAMICHQVFLSSPYLFLPFVIGGVLVMAGLMRHARVTRHWRASSERMRSLAETQQMLTHHASEQAWRLCTHIRAYGQYLDEFSRHSGGYENLGYDVDELQEAAEHLHFLMQGAGLLLEYESGARRAARERCDLSGILTRFLARLTPMLERRAMRIVSDHCPAVFSLHSDPAVLAHVVWAMLIACLYYARDDSSLHIEVAAVDGVATLRLYVTRCDPAALSPEEREAYLSTRLQAPDTHMFAHVLARHPNTLFAERLAGIIQGTIRCEPEGPYRAVLALSLPGDSALS